MKQTYKTLSRVLILLPLLITLGSCNGNLPKFEPVNQYFIRLDPLEDGTFYVRCFERSYDLNDLIGLSGAEEVEPLLCNNLKGFSSWDSYIVPRAEYIKSKVKRVIVKQK